MYSIFLQENTGLWVVKDDSTGKNIARGDTPQIAINIAITKGMPEENREALLVEANTIKQNNPPPNSEPIPDTTANTPNNNNLGGTPASDDESYNKLEAARLANKSNLPTTSGSNEMETQNESFAGSTQAGSANNANNTVVQKNVGKDPKPGTRLYNPLGNFSSYTYQLSLYMVTPEAHTAFVAGGRKNINAFVRAGGDAGSGGAFVILQSGGVNTNLDKRPPGLTYDYYIDDLKIKNVVSGKQTATSSNVTILSFNIIEPIGFSLITKLKRAREALAKVSKIPNIEKAVDPSKHFFVLGIRFQGYDANGEIANASKYFSDDTFNASPDASGVYERFYDIKIRKMSFKLGGSSTTYAVEAVCVPSDIAMTTARGIVDANLEIVADTVGNALIGSGQGITSLFQTINNNIEKSKNAGSREFADVYNVRFLGTGVDVIQNATLKSVANPDKKLSAPSPANNAAQVTDATAQRSTYDSNKVKISITQGMPILQAITKVIRQSSYLEDALKVLFKSEETPNEDTASPDKIEQKDPPTLRWYNVSTEIEVIAFDTKINDFAYKITYVIQPYDTPAASSPYGKVAKYYGPHKRYQYWYTGQNKEIINFDLQFDNTYFQVTFNPNGDPSFSGGAATIAQLGNKPTSQDRTGYITPGAESQNSYVNSLFDPGAYSKAKLTILGDPDYLMRETAPGINEVYKQFYANDGFTINPNGGQVFIEVEFNEGIDYNNEKGTLDINDSIFFWNYPNSVKSQVKGLSYQVVACESNFKSGKFTQDLQIVFNTMSAALSAEQEAAANDSYNKVELARFNRQGSDVRTGTTQTGSTPTPGQNNGSSSASTGLGQDAPVNQNSASTPTSEQESGLLNRTPAGTTPIQTTNTGNAQNPMVANDDSVSNTGKTVAGSSNNNTRLTSDDAIREGA